MEHTKRTTAIKWGVLAAVVAVVTLLYWFNPVDAPFAPKCMFKQLTGLSCPGCGIQRFLHAFLHGRPLEAISYNYMLVVLIPYILLFGIEKLFLTGERQKRWESVLEGRLLTTALCIMAPVWFVIRNILNI